MSGALSAVRYHCGERWQVALLEVARTQMHAVIVTDTGVRVISEAKENARHCEPLFRRDAPYPLARLAHKLLGVGRSRGISLAAKAICEEALQCALL